MTRELFSADPRVGPTDLARGSVFLQMYSFPSEGHSRDPRVVPAGPNWYDTCRFLPEALSRGDTPNSERKSERVEQLYQAFATRLTLLGEPGSDEAVVQLYPCSQLKLCQKIRLYGNM